MLALMGLLLAMMFTGNRISRREGVVLLAGYVVYLAALVGFSLTGHT